MGQLLDSLSSWQRKFRRGCERGYQSRPIERERIRYQKGEQGFHLKEKSARMYLTIEKNNGGIILSFYNSFESSFFR